MNIEIEQSLGTLLQNTGDMALKRRARRIIKEINPNPRDKILDVGCGDGFYLHLLSNLGVKSLTLVGVDVDNNALKSARKNLKGKKVKLIKVDLMDKLPFKSSLFDKIIMSEVCEHLADDVKALKEIKRVLKRGGTLVITVPNQNYPFLWDPVNWILEHFFDTHIKSGFWAGIWNQHLRLYKPEEIKKVINKVGFKIEKIEPLTWWCLPFNHNLLHFAARKLYGGKFSSQVALMVNKYTKNPRRSSLINLVFDLVNKIDRLNDFSHFGGGGVNILVKALK